MLWNPENCQAWDAVAPFIFRYLVMGSGCGWQQYWKPLTIGDVSLETVSFVVPLHPLQLWQSWNCAVSQVFHRVSRCGCSQENCLGRRNLSQALPVLKRLFFFFSQGIFTIGLLCANSMTNQYTNVSDMMQVFILFGILASPVLPTSELPWMCFPWSFLPLESETQRKGCLLQTLPLLPS